MTHKNVANCQTNRSNSRIEQLERLTAEIQVSHGDISHSNVQDRHCSPACARDALLNAARSLKQSSIRPPPRLVHFEGGMIAQGVSRQRLLPSRSPDWSCRVFSPVHAFEQFGGGFVVGVLRDEFAPDGEVEDGLAELLDVLGASGEAREVAEGGSGRARGRRQWCVGSFRRCRDAAASRSRRLSRSACAASSRSHSAISSSTLATMRCCSARGGRGNGNSRNRLHAESCVDTPDLQLAVNHALQEWRHQRQGTNSRVR